MTNGAVAVYMKNGKGYILELNNFLDFTKSMTHSLLCPMQSQSNGVIINDVPKALCQYPYKDNKKIPNEEIEIPIDFHGPIPFIPVRYPTDIDMEN